MKKRQAKAAVSAMTIFLAYAAVGCEETGFRRATQDGSMDGATGFGPEALTYRPAGCAYDVHTPEVREAGMSEPTVGATPEIKHVHTSWPGPSHEGFAVNWASDEETLVSAVLFGTDRDLVEGASGPDSGVEIREGHQLFYASTLLDVETGRARIHEVHLCGLEPETKYFYKVGGSGHWSEVFETVTAPDPGTAPPFAFGVLGDSRSQIDNAWAIAQRKLSERGIDFQVFSGDAVFQGALQDEWDRFFEASDGDFVVQHYLARVPLMAANGNHDALAVNYVAQFAFPQEVSPQEEGQGEQWYSYDYANAHIVVLDDFELSQQQLDAQTSWLRSDLAAVQRDQTPWIFVVHHRPFYTCLSRHRPDTALRAKWQPVFDEYAVDIVFTGHNHVYERSRPIRGLRDGQGQVASAGSNAVPTFEGSRPSGTLYIVAAGVGAPLYSVSDECEFTHIAERSNNYLVVEIEDRMLRATAFDVMSDTVIDSFGYAKP